MGTLLAILGAACLGDAAPALAVSQSGGAPPDPRTLMDRVAASYADTVRGVVGVRSQSLLTIKAPVFRRRIGDDTWYVFVDGALARSGEQHDARQPPLRDPYRNAFLGDYDYAYVACPVCGGGRVAVSYASRFHDVEHASGRLIIDLATAQIVSETEKPYRLPWPTQDGQLEATWGRAAGGWFPLSISGAFIGRIGPFVGHAQYAQNLSGYERFASVESATAALSTPSHAATPTTSEAPHAQK